MMQNIRALNSLTKREILRFTRQRSRWIGALATPLIFWLLVGGGLQGSFQDPATGAARSGNYLQFFFPGALLLSVLFTAIFSTLSVIEDRHQGFLQGVLVSPVPRWVIVLSKVLGGGLLGLLQGVLLLTLAPWVGFELSFGSFLLASVLVFLLSLLLTSLGFLFAWKLDSVQGYHGIMNMVLMPMWLLSGGVFPLSGNASFFKWVGLINPLSYGLVELREILSGSLNVSRSLGVFAGTLALTLLLSVLGTRLVSKQNT